MSLRSLIGDQPQPLLSCKPGDTLSVAVSQLVGAAANAIAVTGADGLLVGILTDHDIVRALEAGGGSLGSAKVEAWMSRPVITVTQDMGLGQAVTLMGQNRIRHVVVVDAARRPLAVVGVRAVLAKLHEQDEIEIHVLRDLSAARR
jgi:CBS domain-containing protein